ncbi:MAG: PIN domain-containing protein [Spirochaetes bacterium]|nr:PIN domain-containing protein [Spirochaetota bacterium]
MNDSKYLIDSNILIYHLNGEIIASEFLEKYISQSCISRLTYIEVLSFNYNKKEVKAVKELLNHFKVIDTSEEIALQALKNRKRKKIKIADNIIASTAQVHNLILVTRNVEDYKSLKLKIINPFD